MARRLLVPLLTMLAAVLASPARADDLAIIIANKAYVNSHEVEYAHNDAERFADAAKRALRIPESRVAVFRDQGLAAMRTLVGRQIAPRINKRTKRLWVYYSGHGFPLIEGGRPPEPYLLPVDGDPGLLKATAISLEDLKKELGALKRSMADGAEIVLVLEACFSGRSSKGAVQPKVSGSAFSIELGPDASILTLAATGADHVASWDHEEKAGLFTALLVETLFGRAGRAPDGRITVDHLQSLIDRELQVRLARLYPGESRRQNPWLGGRTTAPALVAHAEPLPPLRPDEARSAVLMCNALRHAEDPGRIAEFLRSCRECTEECRTALGKRRADIEARLANCGAEGRTLDGLLKSKVARAELEGLIAALTCADVITRAKAALDGKPSPSVTAPAAAAPAGAAPKAPVAPPTSASSKADPFAPPLPSAEKVERARVLAMEITSPGRRASALAAVALSLSRLGRNDEASRLAREAVALFRPEHLGKETDTAISFPIGVLARSGGIDEALQHIGRLPHETQRDASLSRIVSDLAGSSRMDEAKSVLLKIRAPKYKVSPLTDMAVAYHKAGNAAESDRLLTEARAAIRTIQPPITSEFFSQSLVVALVRVGRPKDAIALASSSAADGARRYLLTSLGSVLAKSGHHAEARSAFNLAKAAARVEPNSGFMAGYLADIAASQALAGFSAEATATVSEAEAERNKIKDAYYRSSASFYLAPAMAALKRYDEALAHARSVEEGILRPLSYARVAYALVKDDRLREAMALVSTAADAEGQDTIRQQIVYALAQ